MIDVSVKAVLISFRDYKKVLLIKEASYEGGTNESKWDCPGGTLLAAETIFDCLDRECKEEIGVSHRVSAVLSNGCSVLHVPGDKLRIYVPAIVDGIRIMHPIQLSSHHSEYKWANCSDISDMDLMPGLHAILEEYLLHWPYN